MQIWHSKYINLNSQYQIYFHISNITWNTLAILLKSKSPKIDKYFLKNINKNLAQSVIPGSCDGNSISVYNKVDLCL